MRGLTLGDPALVGRVTRTVITETFNKANGPLGPNLTWTTTAGSIGVVSNEAANTGASGTVTDARAEALLNTSNQYAQIKTVRNGTTSNADAARVCARFDATARTHYFVGLVGDDKYQIFRRVAGAATSLASGNYTWVSGDILRIEVSGSTITIKVNGATLASVTDTNITTGRYTGIGIASNVATLDDFEAGDL